MTAKRASGEPILRDLLPDLLAGLVGVALIAGAAYLLTPHNKSSSNDALAAVASSPSASAPAATPTPSATSTPAVKLRPFLRSSSGRTRVVLVGDAITLGADATQPQLSFRQRFTALLQTGGPVAVVREGASSTTATNAQPATTGAALTVVELGTNDAVAGTAVGDFDTAYGTLLGRVLANSPRTAIVCMGTWRADGALLDEVIQRQCAAHGGAFLPLSDYQAQAALRGRSGLPNDVGHDRIAGRLFRVVKTLTA